MRNILYLIIGFFIVYVVYNLLWEDGHVLKDLITRIKDVL